MVLSHRRIRDRGLLVNLAQRAQIIDTFLHELGHPQLVAIAFTDYANTVQTMGPHPHFCYRASRDPEDEGTHYITETLRKGIVITLTAYVRDGEAA